MTSAVATQLANWAVGFTPSEGDVRLADRSLLDTVSVAVAARTHPVLRVAAGLPEAARWAVAGHVLDFDDLHMQSTAHISVICVPAVLTAGGDARAYLAAAGAMARLGTALGWHHYSAGWHTTCTAGAPAAALGAGMALGLDASRLAVAMALAVPAAGGVHRAFGTDAKSLQVGFAAEAGVRAAQLAAAGATADVTALDAWLELAGGRAGHIDLSGPAVPGDLAIKLFPCCYALQRPIGALVQLARTGLDPDKVSRIVLRTPRGTVTPLIHSRPVTGLQSKFSLEYGVAAALLDSHPGFSSFTDVAVRRPAAQRLVELVDVQLTDGGDGLLAGEFEAEAHVDGEVVRAHLRYPPGSPQCPPTPGELRRKVGHCLAGTPIEPGCIDWSSAAEVLRRCL